jgi:hypothetical protein
LAIVVSFLGRVRGGVPLVGIRNVEAGEAFTISLYDPHQTGSDPCFRFGTLYACKQGVSVTSLDGSVSRPLS